MQTAQTESRTEPQPSAPAKSTGTAGKSGQPWHNFSTIRRNGSVVAFEPGKIAIAMTKALNPGVLDIEAVAVDDSGDESKASITLTGG